MSEPCGLQSELRGQESSTFGREHPARGPIVCQQSLRSFLARSVGPAPT